MIGISRQRFLVPEPGIVDAPQLAAGVADAGCNIGMVVVAQRAEGYEAGLVFFRKDQRSCRCKGFDRLLLRWPGRFRDGGRCRAGFGGADASRRAPFGRRPRRGPTGLWSGSRRGFASLRGTEALSRAAGPPDGSALQWPPTPRTLSWHCPMVAKPQLVPPLKYCAHQPAACVSTGAPSANTAAAIEIPKAGTRAGIRIGRSRGRMLVDQHSLLTHAPYRFIAAARIAAATRLVAARRPAAAAPAAAISIPIPDCTPAGRIRSRGSRAWVSADWA